MSNLLTLDQVLLINLHSDLMLQVVFLSAITGVVFARLVLWGSR